MNPTGLIGVVVLIGIAWLLSENRKRFPWRIVLGGVGLQLVLAVTLIKLPPVVLVFEYLATGISKVIGFADAGIAFIFGEQLLDPSGPWGFIFGVKVLPVIIYFAALMAVLYHIGIMQIIVKALAWMLRRTLGVSGAEALAMAANVFVGQTEAPLCVKPYLEKMSRAALMTLMVGGFATIAGSVLAGYVNFLVPSGDEEERAKWIRHLLTASVMSAPAAFVMARLIVPESPDAERDTAAEMSNETPAANLLDAAATGSTDGLKLALNVGAMLIAFVALLALVNWPLSAIGQWGPVNEFLVERGVETLNLQTILGWVFAPLAWTMGVEWSEASFVGRLMGEKVIVTEFLAYLTLAEGVNTEGMISERTAAIGAFALCGFANFGSIGIQIGGLSAIAPSRRADFVSLAFKAMIGGAFASWMTASIAGIFL